ncbi:MAG: type II toxin-antitoxin system HicB family antitoxin [Candidatus Anammoxibacter sp.]
MKTKESYEGLTMFKYSINLAWSKNDECWIATTDELPGLSAFGETAEEAVKEAKNATQGFLDVYEKDGNQIPWPKYYGE